jgi:hypothetical protein
MKERGKTTQKVKRGSAQVMAADFITAESGRLIGRPPAAPLEPSATEAKADQVCLSRRVNELLDSNDVLWRTKGGDGKKFQIDCKCCKKERSRGYVGKLDLARRNCCARRILAAEADFVEQKSQLEELAERRGHLAFFYPKYHCELINHIKNYWGWSKR